MNIILLGPQGSGKGTQAELLKQRRGFFHVETGKMLRELAKKDEEVNELINVKGEFYPDQKTIELVDNELKREGVLGGSKVFDGFPRNLSQYELLTKWLKSLDQSIGAVFLIDISEEETVRRLSARRTCEVCGMVYNLITNPPEGDRCVCGGKLVWRRDDSVEIIKRRLNLFREETLPIVEQAREEEMLYEIDGERPIEKIYEEIEEILKKDE